jgi:hypothetical protein
LHSTARSEGGFKPGGPPAPVGQGRARPPKLNVLDIPVFEVRFNSHPNFLYVMELYASSSM